jgi:glycosyltransferase involved in cell wall biosynthesis
MRIAVFHELPAGGAFRAVRELGLELKKNHTVDLFYVSEKKDTDSKKYFSSVRYSQFNAKIWKGKNWRIRLYKDTLELYALNKLHQIIALEIDKNKYDVVLVNASKFTQAPFVLRHLRTKSFFYCHDPYLRIVYEKMLDISKAVGTGRYYYELVNRYIRKSIDRKNFMSANTVIANSRFVQRKIRNVYGRTSKVVYLGVDSHVFKPEKRTKKYDILFIGSYEPIDGYSTLRDALTFLPKDIKVKVLDFKTEWIASPQEMAKVYSTSKIVLALAYNEPFGLVPLEAMACGISVIAVAEGGYTESVVDGRTGFLVKREPMTIAKTVNKLLRDNSLRKRQGMQGRKTILERWTWKESALNLIHVFKASV